MEAAHLSAITHEWDWSDTHALRPTPAELVAQANEPDRDLAALLQTSGDQAAAARRRRDESLANRYDRVGIYLANLFIRSTYLDQAETAEGLPLTTRYRENPCFVKIGRTYRKLETVETPKGGCL